MRKDNFIRLLLAVLIVILAMPPIHSQAASPFQSSGFEELASDTLARMTAEERIGQLFLVTFPGTNVGPETQIFDLISNHYISGVILLAQNDNFTAGEQSINDTWTLINQLRTTKFESTQAEHLDPNTLETFNPYYLPLFVGLSQEGNGYPTDQIINGLTPLPSQLAIGATWNPKLAEQVGIVMGSELSELGINLLLGPSLDVNEIPRPEGAGDLGVRTFGGDPFWVGVMGRAYISGVHQGSEGRMAVVSKHFPGLGSSDRLPEDEVATVRKSLEQLKQIELEKPPMLS
jgi:beta-N-acetylhexosaminidase